MTGTTRRKSVRKKSPDSSLIYCRRCVDTKAESNFYTAVDKVLDRNGFFSVCKDCCDEIFKANYGATKDLFSAILNTCRILNVAFSREALTSAEARISSLIQKGKSFDESKIFGYYLQGLAGSKNIIGSSLTNLTFSEPDRVEMPKDTISFESEDEELTFEDYQFEWGRGYTLEEYEWLERRAFEYKQHHSIDTPAEKALLREIVFKEYEIRKAREALDPYDGLLKDFQRLVKDANLAPAQGSNSGKSMETFGMFIKQIEEKEPAEVFGDQRQAFVDWQNIREYFLKYIVRSIKNFITGSKDFNVDSVDDDMDAFDDDTLSESLSGGLDDEE